MKSLIKKITAIAMCGVLAGASAVMANAADTSDSVGTIPDLSNGKVKIVKTYGLGEGKIAAAAYNISNTDMVRAEYKNANENDKVYLFDFTLLGNKVKTITAPTDGQYNLAIYGYEMNGGGSIGYGKIFNDTTAGVYSKVRVKLHDLAPKTFTEKGTTIERGANGIDWEYNYKYQPLNLHDYYNSYLVFRSGGFLTACAPDENGYVELYINTHIGVRTEAITDYHYQINYLVGGGGGSSGWTISKLLVGDTTDDGSVNVEDATTLQKYILDMEELNDYKKFTADINRDGVINIVDATLIQKYVVGLYK